MNPPERVSFPSLPLTGTRLDNILAKFKSPKFEGSERETWAQHTHNALFALDRVRTTYQPLLGMDDRFWRHLQIALLFHDTGKFIQNFQRENRKNEVGGRPNWDVYLRHEMVSTVLLSSQYAKLCGEDRDTLYAVAGHHKSLTPQMFDPGMKKLLDFEEADLDAMETYLQSFLAEHGLANGWKVNRSVRRLLNRARTEGVDQIALNWWEDNFVKPLVMAEDKPVDRHARRRRFANLLGLLHVCDWYGSGHVLAPPPLVYTADDLTAQIREKVDGGRAAAEVVSRPFAWLKFQEKSITRQSVLAIAPTGSGKTEAALLWAAQRPPGGKVIYCLPTRVTSNAIFDRLQEVFPNDPDGIIVDEKLIVARHVGLVHGSAKHYRVLQKEHRVADSEDNWAEHDYLQDKTFFRDFSVCTVDQLLTTGFNLKHWQLKSLHLNGASIIIDEIHMFEPYSLGLIVASIEYLRKYYGARFYIMTATMPKKLRDRLAAALGGPVLLRETSLDDKARNVWELAKDGDICSGYLEERVLADLRANKKVLIVRNTVDYCVETYRHYAAHDALQKTLPKQNRCCLHSRFTQHDRGKKERLVVDEVKKLKNEPFLLVATQVVEVSLDIDFDVIYTENAPIDALSQRAGRVNRKRDVRKTDTRVVVFPQGEVAEYVYGKSRPGVFAETWDALARYDGKRITERQLLALIEQLFVDFTEGEITSYREGLGAYHDIYRRYLNIQDVPYSEDIFTREGLDSRGVMPLSLWQVHKNDPPATRSLYQLSIRKNQLERFTAIEPEPEDASGVFFTIIDDTEQLYDPEIGLTIPPKPENITNTITA